MNNLGKPTKQLEISWILRTLKKGSILDIGSCGADYTYYLFERGYKFVRIDSNPELISQFGEEVIVGDIMDLDPSTIDKFDNIILCSVLEHIGLEAYGNKAVEDPVLYQQLVFDYCFNFLEEQGKLLCTLPYGKFEDGGWFYVYNEMMIKSLIREHNLVSETYFTYDKELDIYKIVPKKSVHMEGKASNHHHLLSGIFLEFINGKR